MYSTFKALMCTTVQPTVSILDEGVLAKLSNSGPSSIAHSRAEALPIPVLGRKKWLPELRLTLLGPIRVATKRTTIRCFVG